MAHEHDWEDAYMEGSSIHQRCKHCGTWRVIEETERDQPIDPPQLDEAA